MQVLVVVAISCKAVSVAAVFSVAGGLRFPARINLIRLCDVVENAHLLVELLKQLWRDLLAVNCRNRGVCPRYKAVVLELLC